MIETQEATTKEVIVVPVKEFTGAEIVGESNFTLTLSEKHISFNSDKIILKETDQDTKEAKERRVHHFFWHLKCNVAGVDYYWLDADKTYMIKIKLIGVADDWTIDCESLSHAKKIAEQIRQWLIK